MDTGTKRHAGGAHVPVEAEIRVIGLRTKEGPGMRANIRSFKGTGKDPALEPSGGAWPC